MLRSVKELRFCYFLLFLLATFGCAQKYYVKDPTSSTLTYSQKAEEDKSLKIDDQRIGEDRNLSVGRLNVVLLNMEDEILFLRKNLIEELRARGISMTHSKAENADFLLMVKKYRIRNHRSSGFSPYQTATTFSADLIKDEETKKVTFYFRIGKVPMWSMKEVIEPCYNIPVSLMIKEIASKINRFYFGFQTPIEEVEALVAHINSYAGNLSFLKVMELGYTNNSAAIKPLLELADHEDGYIRVSAISSLGVLGATKQLDFLKDCYQNRKKDEKLMALKSIGDLDTPEAMEFIRSVKDSPDYQHKRIKEIVDLYF